MDGALYSADMTYLGAWPIGRSENVVVPDRVKVIVPMAFAGCEMSEVSLPEGLEYIAMQSFLYCGGLETICIPASVTMIESAVFAECHSLKEIDVAEHFGLPVSKVRRWIKEGRIQYKEGENITQIHCQICGKTIDFGSVCPECRRKNGLHIYAKKSYSDDDIQSAMRFLGKSEEGKRY